jgi:hypothetical protein
LQHGFNADRGTYEQIINPESWIDDLSFDSVRLSGEWNSVEIANSHGDAMSRRWFIGETPPALI